MRVPLGGAVGGLVGGGALLRGGCRVGVRVVAFRRARLLGITGGSEHVMHADPLLGEEPEHAALAGPRDLENPHAVRILRIQLGEELVEVGAFTVQGC